jgi:hypothetical protein
MTNENSTRNYFHRKGLPDHQIMILDCVAHFWVFLLIFAVFRQFDGKQR